VTQVPSELWPIVCRLATSGEWPPSSEAEVAEFFEFSNRQYLLPLLMEENDLPAEVTAAKPRFRALNALYRKRYELSREGTLELQRVLGVDGFLFYKGSDYRHRLYPRPELRPMNDVDVYVRSTEFSAALARLAAAGYERRYFAFGPSMAPGFHEISLEIKNVHIEIHRWFVQRVRAGIDYDGMWRRRERFERDGISGYRLSAADAILCHAFNLGKDEFSTELNRYVDFYLLLQQHEDQLPECVARAKAWGIERPLFGALYLISTLFPSAGTAAVREAINLLLNVPTRRFLVDRVLPDPATERSGHVNGRNVQLWRKYWLIDHTWRRFAFFAYHVYETAMGAAVAWRRRRNAVAG